MHRAARPFLCGLGVLASAAAAAEPIDTGTEARAWSVFVSPYAWAASLTGDAAIAGRGRFRWDVTQHGPALGLTMRF